MPDTLERQDQAEFPRIHNQPPEVIDINDPDVLASRLARDYADQVRRFVELEIAAKAFPPGEITTEEAATRIVDWVAQQVRPLTAEAREDHDKIKKPYWDCGKVVDAFFLNRIKQLNNAVGPVQRRADLYRQRKEAEQRRREEAARRAAEQARQKAADEAARLAADAQRKVDEGDRPAAIELQTQADQQADQAAAAEKIVNAPPAPVHLHGDYGATGFSVEKWAFEYDDLTELPPRYWKPDDELVQADIDAAARKGETPSIPGVRIWRNDKFIIRKC
jgi:hypothetical protein